MLKNNVIIKVYDTETKKLISEENTHNMVVISGKNLLRDFLYDGSVPTVDGLTHFAVGTSTNATIATDTALGTEIMRDVFTDLTKGATNLVVEYYLPSANANSNTLAEVGLFNANTGGTMYARSVHSPISKTSSIYISYAWTLNWTT